MKKIDLDNPIDKELGIDYINQNKALRILSLLSDPTRLDILCLLKEYKMGLGYMEIMDMLELHHVVNDGMFVFHLTYKLAENKLVEINNLKFYALTETGEGCYDLLRDLHVHIKSQSDQMKQGKEQPGLGISNEGLTLECLTDAVQGITAKEMRIKLRETKNLPLHYHSVQFILEDLVESNHAAHIGHEYFLKPERYKPRILR
jgi:DNA-binding transcriptional ArsR family regulator